MNKNKPLLFNFIKEQASSLSLWIVIACIVLIYSISGRLLPILFGQSINQGILPSDLARFKLFCFLFLGAGFLRTFFGFLMNYFIFKESNWIAYNVRKKLYNHVLNLKLTFFDKNPSGKILTRVANDTKSFQTLLGEGVLGIVINIVEILSILVALTFESLYLSLIIFISFPLVLICSLYLTRKLQSHFYDMKDTLSELNTYLADCLNGFVVIKSYGQFKRRNQKFTKISKSYLDKNLKISYIYALLWPQIEFFQLLSSLICFVAGIYLIQIGSLDLGSLIAFILLIQGFFHPLRVILERINQFQNGYTSSQRIFAVLSEKEEESCSNLSSSQLSNFTPEIEIKNLNFSYEENKSVFKNFNLHLKPYSLTALVGRTGSGKTTLASLIQRLYTPQSGEIYISGRNIKELSLSELRKNICVVRQEDFIFSGSLLENISLSSFDKSDQNKALAALKFSQIQKPLNYSVTTSGGNLSPGERQLLSFARAYYFSPKILIFDEATSFIDEETEKILQEKAKELFKNKTVIIIAHKKSTIKMCDQVVSIETTAS